MSRTETGGLVMRPLVSRSTFPAADDRLEKPERLRVLLLAFEPGLVENCGLEGKGGATIFSSLRLLRLSSNFRARKAPNTM